MRTFFQHWNHAVHDPLRDRDFCRVMQAAGLDFEGLDEEDRLVAHGYWMAIGLLGYQIFRSRALDPTGADVFNRVFLAMMKNPGAADWWRISQSLVPPDYLMYLESIDGPEILPLKDVHPWFVAGASAP